MGDAPGSWRDVMPQRDLDVYAAAGYGQRGRPGRRPALIVIDVTYGFVGRDPKPILESIEEYPNSCGEDGWRGVEAIRPVLQAARQGGAPIFYTGGLDKQFAVNAGRWREKHPRTLRQPPDAHEIVAELAPSDGDVTIRKTKPSAFFGTPLVSNLVDRGVDTLVVTGCTTSGCVRATVIDSFSYGFHTVVVEEGVFDRGRLSHAVNLFDMEQKYADVLPSKDVTAYFGSNRWENR